MDETAEQQARYEAAARRSHQEFVARLRSTDVFQDFSRSFEASIGLPLVLRVPGSYAPPVAGSRRTNPFCALMAARSPTCAACLTAQARVEAAATAQPVTTRCFAGLHESAVPVLMDGVLVAFLQTGQVLFSPPSPGDAAAAVEMARSLDPGLKRGPARAAWRASRVVSRDQYESVLRLLAIFGLQLADISRTLVARAAQQEPPGIARARQYIAGHFAEEISLSTVSRAAGMSRFYFCKTFRQSTGRTFTDYLSRVRIDAVKGWFHDSRRQIGDTAYAAGFHSLSQFNRVFHRLVGERPSAFRDRVCRQATGEITADRHHAA